MNGLTLPTHPRFCNLTGRRFGKLVVLEFSGRAKTIILWKCKCDCGESSTVRANALTSGRTRSCGCGEKDNLKALCAARITHGMANSISEYSIWNMMRQRCSNPKNLAYDRYGARGITVCKRWDSFEQFFSDMGPRPYRKHSIERIVNSLGYMPGNCKWATATEQGRNKRNNIAITHAGVTRLLVEWAEVLRIPYKTLHRRLAVGWSHERCVSTPLCKR